MIYYYCFLHYIMILVLVHVISEIQFKKVNIVPHQTDVVGMFFKKHGTKLQDEVV